MQFLVKIHTKLLLQLDSNGKISTKNVIKQFSSSKEDREKIEKALDAAGQPSAKVRLNHEHIVLSSDS